MAITLRKNKIKDATISVISSKSYTIRLLLCAYLSNQEVEIKNNNYSKDVLATINVLKSLGSKIIINKDNLIIKPGNKVNAFNLYIQGSATLLRLIIPIMLIKFPNKAVTYILDDSLVNRPLDGYDNLFKTNGIKVKRNKNKLIIKGKLRTKEITVDASKSSQFVSGLLIALPLSNLDTKLIFKTNGSSSYIDLTIDVLNQFSIEIAKDFVIKGKQKYIAKNELISEGDYSSIIPFVCLGLKEDVMIRLHGLNKNSKQGDKRIIDYLLSLGANIQYDENDLTIKKSDISSLNYDINECIDLAPSLFLFATTLKEPSTFYHINRLIYKESNRLEAITKILDEIDAKYEINEDNIVIYPCNINKDLTLKSYNDHRIIMAISILVNKHKILINDYKEINKSYPTFYKHLKQLGIAISYSRKPKLLINVKNSKDFNIEAFGYVLGYEKFTFFASKYFSYSFIKKHAQNKNIYVLLNALLHESEINLFKREINKLLQLPINFIVQDIGILNILAELISPKRIIFMPYTLICNYLDAQSYAKLGVSAICPSNEITIEDTDIISQYAPVMLNAFSYVPMYQSYRKIISLFAEYKNISFNKNHLYLKEETRNDFYPVIENQYGSVIFRPYITSYIKELNNLSHAKFIYIDHLFIKNRVFNKVCALVNDYYKNKINIGSIKRELDKFNINIQDGFAYQDSFYLEK